MNKPFLLPTFIFLLFTGNLMAYIDPGSGSAILSAIIGFLVAIGLIIKTYWFKLKGLFMRKPKSELRQDE